MKAKLIIENKEIEIEISEEEYKKLQPPEEKIPIRKLTRKKTNQKTSSP